jgi:TolB-like protein/DNA-binding SARP family transcriptional activator/Flp pilus assembly protein TadD
VLSIGVLGSLEIRRDSTALALPPSRKTRALLAYLALAERPQRRERLCTMLWELPDDPRGSLRWSLSKIRSLVDEPGAQRLVTADDAVALEHSGCQIDLVAVRGLLAGGVERVPVADLAAAAMRFRGAFLEGLELPQCPEFHAWYVAQREDARRLRARLAAGLVERLKGEPETALVHARALIEADPASEQAWATLVELIAASGRPREAAEHYAIGERVLSDAGRSPSGPLLRAWRTLRAVGKPTVPPPEMPGNDGGQPMTTAGDADARAAASENRGTPPGTGRAGRATIVVLPFRGIGVPPEHAFFAEGITEDLTTTLSRILGLFVISRDTASVIAKRQPGVVDAARSLGVRYALHGTVRTAPDRVRVTAILVDAADGSELWADRFDAPLGDVFAVQDLITTAVVRALQIELLEGEQAVVWHRSTGSVEAWSLLTQGLAFFKQQTKEGVHRARGMFERAVAVDPGYAAAWAWLAYAHWHDARFLWTERPEDALARASALARKALELDRELSEVHCVLAIILVLERAFDEAIAAARTAVELNANSAEAAAVLAFVLTWAGDPEQAEHFALKAIAACPLHSGWHLATLAHAQRLQRRFERALHSYEDAIRHLPSYIMPRIGLAMCLAEMGRIEEARRQAAEVLRLDPRFSTARHAAMSRYRDEEHARRRLVALRAAGLPD